MGIWHWCIARLSSWLFAPARGRAEQQSEFPIEPNESEIVEELQLREEARRLGQAGQPGPNSVLPAGIEAQIVLRIDKARLSYLDWASMRLAIFNDDTERLDIASYVNRANQAADEFARKASALLGERVPQLRALKEAVTRCDIELDGFRQRNGLERPAHFPKHGGTRFRYALLFLLVVIEASVNTALFATGLDGGLSAGFVTAFGFALFNVAVAASLGRLVVPNIWHCQAIRKVTGALGLIGAVTAMTGISLFIAHYRDALNADADAADHVALQSLTHAPWNLDTVLSWALFGLSLLFAAIALADGVCLDDLYPGYGRVSRRAEGALGTFEDEAADVRETLEELKENGLKQLTEDVKSAQAQLVRKAALLQSKTQTLLRVQNAMRNAERCLQSLITLFRTENEMHRNGLPPPPSFSVMPTLSRLPIPDFKLDDARAVLADQQARVDQLVEKVESLRAAIQASFNQEFDMLTSLDAHLRPANTHPLKEVAA